jgi:hypothetical protein
MQALSYLAGAAVIGAPLAGLVPRAGPGRALALALRSLVAAPPSPQSARASDVASLRRKLATNSAQRYVVVEGPKGVGKSCAIDTALQRTCGVVVVEVAPGAAQGAIVRAALEAVAGTRPNFTDPRPSALRVLWWYRRLLPPPIVVLRVSERSAGGAFAQTAGAVRSLVGCGLRAVIDSSPNSLEPEALSTLRQDVLHLAPMPRELLQSLGEHEALVAMLRKEGLEDAVWAVLGGVPALYTALHDEVRAATPEGARRAVAGFLSDLLSGAIARLRKCEKPAALLPILAQFRAGAAEVPAEALEGAALPSPNKVLREAQSGAVYVPADAAMALVLRHGWARPPTLEALCSLCTPG